MMNTRRPLILASGSPRRKELLALMGLPYEVDVSDADETIEGTPAPQDIVRELSRRKALSVAPRHESALVLAADTIVYLDGVLGKPKTHERAAQMLRELSGKWHDVYTGLTLIDTATGALMQRVERTRVHFAPMTQKEIEAYAATDEPLDKAGAYAVQGMGGMFVDRIEGSHSNVIGLPMSALRELLAQMDEAQ